MPRPIINRKELASILSERHGFTKYEVLDFINYLDYNIKEAMRSNAMPSILLNHFLKLNPRHVNIIQSLGYKYLKLISNMLKGDERYTLENFENDFNYLMPNYISKYGSFVKKRRAKNRVNYYKNFYNKFK